MILHMGPRCILRRCHG